MNYVRNHSIGSSLWNAFSIYFRHFLILFGLWLPPSILLGVVQLFIPNSGPSLALLYILDLLLAIFVVAGVTIAVSEICLGQRPTIRRSYGRLLRVLGPLLWTNFLTVIVVFGPPALIVGLLGTYDWLIALPILLYIIVTAIYLMFSTSVVVLEHSSGINALKRSINLVTRHFWRISTVIIAMVLLHLVFSYILLIILTTIVDANSNIEFSLVSVFFHILSRAIFPLAMIATVLLYYTCRVRKEHFDIGRLTQELVR